MSNVSVHDMISSPLGSPPTRRSVLAGLAASLCAPGVRAAEVGDTLTLWPGRLPGAPAPPLMPHTEQRSTTSGFNDRWLTGIDRPELAVRRPAWPNGAAVMLCPGGGYGFLAWDNEGEEQARWLNALGVTAFILRYRLPAEGWDAPATVPLADAQRGLRLIRSRAKDYGLNPDAVAVLGFSAGGHLAGSLATRAGETTYAPVDDADRLSSRPDLAGLIYPVVSMEAAFTHAGSRDNLLGNSADVAARRRASVELDLTAETPPIFLAHASDDGTVPIANSLALYQAMIAAKRPGELHTFDKGGHGFGVRLPAATPASAWPTLFASYARKASVFPT